MSHDKYNAVWVSHSSIGDFLKCPRAYFLHNIYRNEKGRKVNLINAALSLGQAVHSVLEGLARVKTEERFAKPLERAFEEAWGKISGKRGGFVDDTEEREAKERGRAMIERVTRNPGPLKNKTVRLKEGEMLPNFYLSEPENIILCGKIDWIEYLPEDDSVRLLDFKTGRNEEKEESLQLPIYLLLLRNLQRRRVTGASYWYLEREDTPRVVALPDYEGAFAEVLEKARKIKEARERGEFICPKGAQGCYGCRPFEKILRGEAEYIGMGEYKQELYLVK